MEKTRYPFRKSSKLEEHCSTWIYSTVIKTKILARQNPVTHTTVKHRFICVLMGSKCPASPEDAGYTGWAGEQGDGVVIVVLLAKNCNEMLGLNSLIQEKLWYPMDLFIACNKRTRRVTNIPRTYLVLLAPESF